MIQPIGTSITFDKVKLKFVRDNFRVKICPNLWPSYEYAKKTYLQNQNYQMTLIDYDYLTVLFYEGTLAYSPSRVGAKNFSIELERVKLSETNLLSRFHNIHEALVELLHNFYDDNIHENIVFLQGPRYRPCITLSSNISHSYFLPSSGYSAFIYAPLNLLKVAENWTVAEPIRDSHITFYTGDGEQELTEDYDGHFTKLHHHWAMFEVTFRHYMHYDNQKRSCINKTEHHAFLPMDFAALLCHRQCYETAFAQVKNCSFTSFLFPKRGKICDPYEADVDQWVKYSDSTGYGGEPIEEPQLWTIYHDCVETKNCKARNYCDEWEVRLNLLYNDPNDCKLTKSIKEKPKFPVCSEFKLGFRIYDNIETIIEYPIRNINNAISDYGGQLGLWVGISLLGMVKSVAFWLWSLHYKHKKAKRKRKQSRYMAALKRTQYAKGKIERAHECVNRSRSDFEISIGPSSGQQHVSFDEPMSTSESDELKKRHLETQQSSHSFAL